MATVATQPAKTHGTRHRMIFQKNGRMVSDYLVRVEIPSGNVGQDSNPARPAAGLESYPTSSFRRRRAGFHSRRCRGAVLDAFLWHDLHDAALQDAQAHVGAFVDFERDLVVLDVGDDADDAGGGDDLI